MDGEPQPNDGDAFSSRAPTVRATRGVVTAQRRR